ncbi:hypothetical protein N431DRAFT_331075 [Stipitochalara longipes BDJ]|nr:hypothetical protein N431DRAFT_331075 [Stipitochalara longipes BDJ]
MDTAQPAPTGPNAPKLWRSTKKRKASSIASATSSVQGSYTFGMKAPIVDFFEHDYITKFAPLEDILLGKANEIMEEAYKADPMEEAYLPWTAGGYKFRWIHIPANNMVWIEEIIKKVCESKGKSRSEKSKGDEQKAKSKALTAGDILSDKYWKNQQAGCLEHCANHPLYARHMVPFFAEIPTDWEAATASVVAAMPEAAPIEDLAAIQTPATPNSKLYMDTAKTTREPSEPAETTSINNNMVLFMPYLHWATTGADFDRRNAVIRELTEKFKNPRYRRPTPEEIDEEQDSTIKLKIMRAFLLPKNDRCLHVERTLDQYYYSTSTDADERTVDQIVYKFAMKQHRMKVEEAEKAKLEEKKRERDRIEWRKWERLESFSQSSRSQLDAAPELSVRDTPEERVEASWDPPKVMMVNQLWMWIIDNDTVITSFPAKNKSELSMNDRTDTKDYMEGDDIYDSTDIWRAVQRELRHKTTYGQRTAKSALDLAWTIADQARGVFQKRNLHPHLQFLQMFEMEINEITFRQQAVFASFSRNVKAAQNANNMLRLLGMLSNFRAENESTTETQIWKDNFRVFAIDFKRRFNRTVSAAQSQAKAQGKFWPARVDSSGSSISSPRPSTVDVVDDRAWATVLKHTYSQLQETLENANLIRLTHEDIEAQLLESLISSFTDLEAVVRTAHSTASLTNLLNSLITFASKTIDWYTEHATENLFDFTTEANLMTEIKDVLDELNIISCITRQQATVIKPFMRDMLNQSLDTEHQDKSFYDSSRMETQIEELQKTARSTYAALQHQLDLKQKQISVIEARAARKEARASAEQAASSLLLNTHTVRQGGVIMIFTVVTIIFLPLSFFTGLFGMNAKELLSEQYTMGYYSMIMYPVSFAITAISLGLALAPECRVLLRHASMKVSSITWQLWVNIRTSGIVKLGSKAVGRVWIKSGGSRYWRRAGNLEEAELENGPGMARWKE